jgi:beta-lactamase class A
MEQQMEGEATMRLRKADGISGLSRRHFLTGVAGIAAMKASGAKAAAPGGFADIEQRLQVRLGVAALNTVNGVWLRHRADERFAMCSTFKWILVALALRRIEVGDFTLDRRINYSPSDLLEYAPVARANVARGWLSVEELCAASVQVSDNTAANLLLDVVGGPNRVTQFVRSIGDPVTRLDRREPELNENAAGDPRDTTTPAAMATTASTLLLGKTLSQRSQGRLTGWMITSTRGLDRLRAGLPASWRAGTKAGTGPNGALNDVAIAWPPGRAPILVASFMTGGNIDDDARSAGQADVARAIVAAWS